MLYQEGVAAVSTGDAGPGGLGVGTGRTGMNWAQINYPLTVKKTDANTLNDLRFNHSASEQTFAVGRCCEPPPHSAGVESVATTADPHHHYH